VQADDALALARLREPDFPHDRCLVLAEGTPVPPGAAIGSAQIVLDRPDRVSVDIAPSAPGWLLLADTHFPGWTARVDGQVRTIERADVALRAVAVRPGDRRVDFRYEPLSVRAGLALSGLSALVLLAAVITGARRSRARRRPAPAERDEVPSGRRARRGP
jgi:hypothetical protein